MRSLSPGGGGAEKSGFRVDFTEKKITKKGGKWGKTDSTGIRRSIKEKKGMIERTQHRRRRKGLKKKGKEVKAKILRAVGFEGGEQEL